jgi:hypothetical protein
MLARIGVGRAEPLESKRHHLMYNGVMSRTQIYLGDEELELLDRVGRATGASRSELIRRAVRTTYGEKSAAAKLSALDASAGSWTSRRMAGAEYVDAVRGDLNERLRRAGLE